MADLIDDAVPPEFRWPENPPADWWCAEGYRLGLDDPQIRFAATLFRLGSDDPTLSRRNLECATIAGFSGGRQKAFQLARSVRVRKILDAAKKIRGGEEPAVSEAEIDRLVARLMRSSAPAVCAKGIELHDRRADAKRSVASESRDPMEALHAIAGVSPQLAAQLAEAQGLPIDFEISDEQRARLEEQRMMAARDWIWENPHRAFEFVKMAMQPRTNGSGHPTEDTEHGMGESNAAV